MKTYPNYYFLPTAIFVLLKLFNQIDWSWFWVLFPAIILFIALSLPAIVFVILHVCLQPITKRKFRICLNKDALAYVLEEETQNEAPIEEVKEKGLL